MKKVFHDFNFPEDADNLILTFLGEQCILDEEVLITDYELEGIGKIKSIRPNGWVGIMILWDTVKEIKDER